MLEHAYQAIRDTETALHLDDLPPEQALRELGGATVNYQLALPEFTRLVMTENIHCGEFLAQSKAIHGLNMPAIDAIDEVYQRGCAAGQFRPGPACTSCYCAQTKSRCSFSRESGARLLLIKGQRPMWVLRINYNEAPWVGSFTPLQRWQDQNRRGQRPPSFWARSPDTFRAVAAEFNDLTSGKRRPSSAALSAP